MERLGEVTKVDGKWLEITFCRPADCEKCRACHGGQKSTVLRLKGEAKVGDYAVVSMPEDMIYRASAVAYALPLVGLVTGMMLGEALVPTVNSVGGIVGGLVGLAIPAAVIRLTEGKRQSGGKYQPELVRIIRSSNGESQP